MRTVRESVLDVLRARGMTTLFGNPGSTELPMLKEFPEDFRYVLGLQEAVVVGMADGFALASGSTALVNLHTGPGTGNAMGAILNARANRTPMVVTAGQQVRAMLTMEALLTNPQATHLPLPAVKWAYEPPRPVDVAPALARGVQIAETPARGPVFLSLPMDDFDAEVDEDTDRAAARTAARTVGHAASPGEEAVRNLADRLASARGAVLVVGNDVDASGAWDDVVALAERTGLPVWSAPTEGRVSFPKSHPQYRGVLPPGIAPLSGCLAGHDLVFVIGAPVFCYYPYLPGSYLPDGAELVQLTRDADEAARAPVGDALVADLSLTVRALLAHLPGLDPRGAEHAETPSATTGAAPVTDTDGLMSPLTAMTAIAKGAPENTLWVNESPSNLGQFHEATRISRPGSFLFTAGGGLGFGLAAAVGAQLGAPERPVVCVIGDGSTHYAVQALWTAATYKVPVTFVVLSNQRYAILQWFAQLEQAQGAPGLDIPGLDIVSVALGYGVRAHRMSGAAELTKFVRESTLQQEGPVLLDVPVSTELPSL
ncbi:benzoylformate decarboxylase [Streptomyces sp. NBC_00237]|uniref:benzoylformate decarboxylase n=1 Tax=Streptomyces sp. NBC_00237 TaxID=2975687 RepID=UPI002258DFDE|nr:benzoylformate decarboxylase [Streptomyces sp. NBC_00237]MCX5202762.1 benzoylformate decarboxylase [Streptomyces sp. NBC_00237]